MENLKGFSYPKRGLLALMLVTFLIQSVGSPYALAQVDTSSAPTEEIQASDIPDSAIDQTTMAAEASKVWSSEQEAVAGKLLELNTRIFEHAAALEQTIGKEKTDELINQGFIEIKDGDQWRVEIKVVDGIRFARIINEYSGTSYLMLDKETIDPESSHLRQIIARQHIEAGEDHIQRNEKGEAVLDRSGKPKVVTGRDVVLVWMDKSQMSGDPVSIPKPHVSNPRWWSDYFYSKYKKPTGRDVSLALVSGTLMQGTLTTVFSAMMAHFTNTPMHWSPTIISAVLGSGVGIYFSTYKNWTMSGTSKIGRVLKASTVSFLFAYSMAIFANPHGIHEGLAALSFFKLSGLALHASLGANMFVNNFTKDSWNRILAMRVRLRENAGTQKFRILGKTVDSGWNKSNFEGSLLYLINFSLKTMDFFCLQFEKIPHTGFSVPGAQILGFPVALWANRKYAEYLASRPISAENPEAKAKEAQRIYENAKYEFDFYLKFGWVPLFSEKAKAWGESLKSSEVGQAAIKAKNFCVSSLTFF